MHYIWYILWSNLSFNSKRSQSFSVIFDFSLLEWIAVKSRATIFDYVCTFWDIGQYYIFVSFEIGNKTRKSFMTRKPQIFWAITGTVCLSGCFLKCIPFLKEILQRFFELEFEHCTLKDNFLRRLILFHWYCNFNPPTRLNEVWYLWNAWYFS